jgi:hypothetical protein
MAQRYTRVGGFVDRLELQTMPMTDLWANEWLNNLEL